MNLIFSNKLKLIKSLILISCSLLSSISCENDSKFSDPKNDEYNIENTIDEKILLRLTPEIGDKISNELKLEIRPNRGIIPLNTEVIANLNMRVNASNESGNILHLDFQRFRMSTDLMGAKVNYDSQSGENALPQEMTDEFEKLLAKKIIMNVDSLGQIEAIKMQDEMLKSESLNMNLNAIFLTFPSEKVGTGDFWTRSQTIVGLGEIEIKFVVDKITESKVLIQILPSDRNDRIYDIEGTYLIDRKSGFAEKGTLEVKDDSRKIEVKISLNSDL